MEESQEPETGFPLGDTRTKFSEAEIENRRHLEAVLVLLDQLPFMQIPGAPRVPADVIGVRKYQLDTTTGLVAHGHPASSLTFEFENPEEEKFYSKEDLFSFRVNKISWTFNDTENTLIVDIMQFFTEQYLWLDPRVNDDLACAKRMLMLSNQT